MGKSGWRKNYDRLNSEAEKAADRGDLAEYERKGKQIEQVWENGPLRDRLRVDLETLNDALKGR